MTNASEAAFKKKLGLQPLNFGPIDAAREVVIPDAVPLDDRLWIPQEPNLWIRPLLLCASRGYWVTLLRSKKAGILSRHRHPQPVHGYVIKGTWRYLEHDWIATEGGYVYEPPGETHTLVMGDGVDEMITLFQVNGAMIYLGPEGELAGYDDVHTKIEQAREHYEKVGIGAAYVDGIIR
ncbi:MAG: 2,4'-dihydroxyacetophenone dioxygenase family protein [Rhizobiaceae bacterium]|nr:2,4'-dihydroxyacetophenone dioxygenase family protein [Rhizobiaceae bacterium]